MAKLNNRRKSGGGQPLKLSTSSFWALFRGKYKDLRHIHSMEKLALIDSDICLNASEVIAKRGKNIRIF